eukprot:13634279-Ditylum_brightwellii.AAC.1
MGVTVRKLPPVKLFDGWLDEHTYFESDKPSIKISNILNLIYSTLSKYTYKKINDKTIKEYDDEVKKLIAYSTNSKTKKHYQHYKNQ